jgi:hypothetical protein
MCGAQLRNSAMQTVANGSGGELVALFAAASELAAAGVFAPALHGARTAAGGQEPPLDVTVQFG